jgi:cytochrome c-type biogenesis protein CcmH
MTLFWIILGLMVLVAIAAIIKPFVFTKAELTRGHMAFLGVTVIAVSVSAFLLYDEMGEPGYVANPPQPIVSAEIMEKIHELERVMQLNPNDPEGWQLLAGAYTRLGQAGKAMDAYRNVVTLDPTNTTAKAALGGLLIATSAGTVPPEAMQLFQSIIDSGIKQPMAYFYLGLGHMQQGDYEQAYDVWQVLAENSPEGAPWNAMLRESLSDVAGKIGKPMPQMPGPETDPAPRQGN